MAARGRRGWKGGGLAGWRDLHFEVRERRTERLPVRTAALNAAGKVRIARSLGVEDTHLGLPLKY